MQSCEESLVVNTHCSVFTPISLQIHVFLLSALSALLSISFCATLADFRANPKPLSGIVFQRWHCGQSARL